MQVEMLKTAVVSAGLVSRSHTNYAPAAYRCSDYKAGAYNRNIDKRLARNWYGYARLQLGRLQFSACAFCLYVRSYHPDVDTKLRLVLVL